MTVTPDPKTAANVWSAAVHDEIIKRLMAGVGMPNSNSLYGAFKQFANELHALAHAAQRSDVQTEPEGLTDTFTCNEMHRTMADRGLRLASTVPSAERESQTDRCANCGYPLSEHGYNNACYGIFGKFVSSVSSTEHK